MIKEGIKNRKQIAYIGKQDMRDDFGFFTCASMVWTNLKPIWDVSYIRIWGKCRDVFNVFFYDHIDHNIDQVDCYPNHLSILTGTHEYVSSSGVGSTKDFVFESSNLSIDEYTDNWTIIST